MSQSHLTHKYRPQTFAEVAGQETIKAILSRAASTGRIAPAYMFSGTRGVGKTTIARIFAKAINCERGPAAEPCNECVHCRQIAAGAAVDVAEIDGASNTGVDDVRSLKEDVGFAPIDCRYKVFIIDEAHMLSKSAFNALLKTLEEPPAHVTFIMATTEPHKFPPTIISRCQHYTFQRLTQKELETHLVRVLDAESLGYEHEAVALLARRGAGSVRDSMSLLGQVLALGSDSLTSADVRTVLGLAGRDIMFRLMEAIHGRDCVAVSTILSEILDQGLDLGFFLRELTEVWRTLFLLAQAGERALPILDIPEEEARQWLTWVPRFSVAHIHACWQLTLEGQQRVRQSLEPALALELLLLNLAYLPELVGLEGAGQGGGTSMPPAGGAPSGGARPMGHGGVAPGRPASASASAAPARSTAHAPSVAAPDMAERSASPERPAMPERSMPQAAAPVREAATASVQAPAADVAPAAPQFSAPRPESAAPAPSRAYGASRGGNDSNFPPVPAGPKTWDSFIEYATACKEATGRSITGLLHVRASVGAGRLTLECANAFHCEQIKADSSFSFLQELVRAYFGPECVIDFRFQQKQRKNRQQIKDEVSRHPVVAGLMRDLDAQVVSAGPRTDRPHDEQFNRQ
ncbi:DNA polymerase-3 subunit gamma/tau [Desulfobaculum xiamenense]|uniref:DNA polymerase III subunit gamma/tau n=1 Tax=Desulfobaculum xiamenense TaxID=995050 RepID=A0A846QE18_9BACT|nr:DNA polymerase III subunit gamma/tau [Desulfobaculum xiamenense]NJB66966.1 DNA polymerase-3 subunit gamma/tau [Desulfobaculum xiamenense]